MRAPFQILALPYRMNGEEPLYCIFRRADFDQWQFISGGGEDTESPMEAAIREILEERMQCPQTRNIPQFATFVRLAG